MRNTFKFTAIIIMMMSLSPLMMASVKGKGEVVKQKRTLDKAFKGVVSSEGISVYITYGGEFNLEVETYEDIIDRLITKVSEEGYLEICFEGNVNNIKTRNVYLTTSNLEYLEANSGSKIKVENTIKRDEIKIISHSGSKIYVSIDVDSADINSHSGSSITLEGSVDNLEISSNSGSRISAMKMKAYNCDASASSGSRININVYGNLKANASSSGDINYKGNPNITRSSESSTGRISRKR